jgi:hypothetical protein
MPARALTYPEIDKAYSAILRVKEGLPSHLRRREQLELLITACIVHGFDTRHLIVKWLSVAGRSPNSIAKVLDERTGPTPGKHLWKLGDDGCYTVHDVAPATRPSASMRGAADLSFMDDVK